MKKLLDIFCSERTGYPLVVVGIFLLSHRTLLWINTLLYENYGVYLNTLNGGFAMTILGITIIYLNKKYNPKKEHNKNTDSFIEDYIIDKNFHIAELETKIIEKDRELAVLKVKIEQLQQGPGLGSLETHGLCGRVIMWRREGKTEEEIAAILSDAGKWCSAAQIGALLYLKEGRVSKDAMQKHGQRLLGTA